MPTSARTSAWWWTGISTSPSTFGDCAFRPSAVATGVCWSARLAQHDCDLESFVIWALSEELGIVTAPKRRREISDDDVADLVAYVRRLPPPAGTRTSDDDELFERVLCSRCHVPVTGVAQTAGTEVPVRAYTDLLLHELGGGQREGERDSRKEFRTPPLWGTGATGPPYLHDGSAKTLEHAILRHGGEASESRDRYIALTKYARQRLLRFVATR